MSASLLESLKTGAPAPKVVLLQDSCFFVRSIDVSGAPDQAAVDVQVELALETLSPFPVAQLLHGFHWVPGAQSALVFAAYRRRFTADEVETWSDADWVAPAFCSILSYPAKPGTTVLYSQELSFTAVHWGASGTPIKHVCRPFPADASDELKQQVRDEVLREVGETRQLVELPGVPAIQASSEQGVLVFQAGSATLSMPESVHASHDIRPVEVLDSIRRSRRNDLLLWRAACGLVGLLGVLLLAELSLYGLGFLHRARQLQVTAQEPVVAKIESSHALAFRIDELATKRLLPFEMITIVSEKRPRSVQFDRTTASTSGSGIYSIRIDAHTANSGDDNVFIEALRSHPSIASVEVSDLSSRDRTTKFTLVVTFKPEALKPANS